MYNDNFCPPVSISVSSPGSLPTLGLNNHHKHHLYWSLNSPFLGISLSHMCKGMMHHARDQLGPKTAEPRSSGSLLMVRHSSTRLSLNKELPDLETTYYKDVESGYIVTFRQRHICPQAWTP